MDLIFFGTPTFAVPSLRALHGAGHRILCVVTQPDRPRGRGRQPAPPAVKKAALDLGLETLQPNRAGSPDIVEMLAALEADLGVVIAYGEILKPDLLDATERGFVNAHASLLPDYRGAAPINWAVMRGENVTGVTIIRMEPELDAGPILAQREVPISDEETAGQLHDRLAEVAADLLCDVVNRMDAGETIEERRQPAETGFFARKLTKEDGRIDWTRGAAEITDRVRGLTPWPGAYGALECKEGHIRVTLLRVKADETEPAAGPPGTVLRADEEEGIVVRAGGGAVRILKLKPAGSRAMSAADFLHGHDIEPGDRFRPETNP
mgnify:FL=1